MQRIYAIKKAQKRRLTQEHYTSNDYAALSEKQIQQERARLKDLDKYIVPLDYQENAGGTVNNTN